MSGAPSDGEPGGARRGRIVAVDYGARRVGLAMADPLELFAQPVGTVSPGEALVRLAALDAEHGIATLVVGWPLDDAGDDARAVARVGPFIGRARRAVPGAEIVRVDETESSRRAMRELVASGVRKKARGRKGALDAAAACVILEDYLRER